MKLLAQKDISRKSKQRGFTLIELIVVLTIVAITAGISADIVISLVRSFNKTQVLADIERTGTLALSKIEKELRTSNNVILPDSNPATKSCRDELVFAKVSGDCAYKVTYRIVNTGTLLRVISDTNPVPACASAGVNAATSEIVDPSFHTIRVVPNPTSEFCVLPRTSDHPYVVQVRLVLESTNTSNASLYGQSTFNQVVVLRGSY